ncbi:MAG: hypothetical protein VXY82_04405 [Planctomycetota bacterium]|jgi:hypothetical protein|nr:hypothetical protein [Planctomycetota bacterium]MEC8570282.1 hypothetical protein [Planctomycetota bacterium]
MSESVMPDALPKVDCLSQKVDSHLALCGNLAGKCKSDRVTPQEVLLAGEIPVTQRIPVTRRCQKSDSQRRGHNAEENLGD